MELAQKYSRAESEASFISNGPLRFNSVFASEVTEIEFAATRSN